MKITFSYDLDKDAENFIKSAHSVNNKKPTALQETYISRFGDNFNMPNVASFIQSYIQENNIDVEAGMLKIRMQWKLIESEFIRRAENIFGVYSSDVHAYLSTNSRCTYNIEQNYFFVFLESKHANAIIMHELWHFYTWKRLHAELMKADISPGEYNDIKESLTVLLNLECKDLLEGHEDRGYPQHSAMREFMRSTWINDKNLEHLVATLATKSF